MENHDMKEITIDCGAMETKADFHTALASALAFPAHYGNNLDALYDCLTEIGQDTCLILQDWHHAEYHLGDYSGKAVYVFHYAIRENPHLRVQLIP